MDSLGRFVWLGWFMWLVRMVCSDGSFDWFIWSIHLVDSSGWFIWLVQLVGSLDLFHLAASIGFVWFDFC